MNPTLAWSTRLRRRRRRPCSEPRQCLDWPPTSTASTPRRAPRPSSALCGFHRSAGWRCIPRAVHRSCHRLQTSASSTAFPAVGPALRRRSTGTSVASGTATLVPTPGGEDWPRPRGRGIVWLPVWQRGSKTPSSDFLVDKGLGVHVFQVSRYRDGSATRCDRARRSPACSPEGCASQAEVSHIVSAMSREAMYSHALMPKCRNPARPR